MRERLPNTRKSITHKFVLRSPNPSGKTGKLLIYITVGLYNDGRPGEIFYTINASGEENKTPKEVETDILYYETLRGWSKQWAIAISLCLQSKIPLTKIVEKFSHQDYPPQGMTDNPDIPMCKSIVDYTVRWVEKIFGDTK
jgi:ribonucleoside-diphosphate reductase alpha chain